MVSDNYFPVLGVSAYAGRTFSPSLDANPGREPAVIISYSLWQRRFGGKRELIGNRSCCSETATRWSALHRPRFAA